jgi:hypothetical protein
VLVEPIGPRFGSEPPTGSGARERPTCALPANALVEPTRIGLVVGRPVVGKMLPACPQGVAQLPHRTRRP